MLWEFEYDGKIWTNTYCSPISFNRNDKITGENLLFECLDDKTLNIGIDGEKLKISEDSVDYASFFFVKWAYMRDKSKSSCVKQEEVIQEERNQDIKQDAGKYRPTLVPTQIIKDIAEVREYGVKKYGDSESWKQVEIGRYRDAAYRHFLEYISDPSSKDLESRIGHLKHLACNIAFLCELENKIFGG